MNPQGTHIFHVASSCKNYWSILLVPKNRSSFNLLLQTQLACKIRRFRFTSLHSFAAMESKSWSVFHKLKSPSSLLKSWTMGLTNSSVVLWPPNEWSWMCKFQREALQVFFSIYFCSPTLTTETIPHCLNVFSFIVDSTCVAQNGVEKVPRSRGTKKQANTYLTAPGLTWQFLTFRHHAKLSFCKSFGRHAGSFLVKPNRKKTPKRGLKELENSLLRSCFGWDLFETIQFLHVRSGGKSWDQIGKLNQVVISVNSNEYLKADSVGTFPTFIVRNLSCSFGPAKL